MAMADLPAPIQMLQLLSGFQLSQALFVAARLGVSDELLEGPRTVDQMAMAVGAHRAAFRRHLEMVRQSKAYGAATVVVGSVGGVVVVGGTVVVVGGTVVVVGGTVVVVGGTVVVVGGGRVGGVVGGGRAAVVVVQFAVHLGLVVVVTAPTTAGTVAPGGGGAVSGGVDVVVSAGGWTVTAGTAPWSKVVAAVVGLEMARLDGLPLLEPLPANSV